MSKWKFVKIMNKKHQEAKDLLDNGQADAAISLLQELLAHPEEQTAQTFFELGCAYRKKGNWQEAINNYRKGADLSPDSPAADALEMMNDILNFYNKDMFNQ